MNQNNAQLKQLTSGNPMEVIAEYKNEVEQKIQGEILARQVLVSHEFYACGKPMMQIAAEQGLKYSMVARTLKDIRENCDAITIDWKRDFVAQAFDEIEQQKVKFNIAWQRELELMEKEEFTEKGLPQVGPDGKTKFVVTESIRHRTKEQLNVKPIEGILKCILAQAKLLEIGEGKKGIESEVGDKMMSNLDSMNPEEKAEAFADFFLRVIRRSRENNAPMPDAQDTAVQFITHVQTYKDGNTEAPRPSKAEKTPKESNGFEFGFAAS